MYSQYSSTTPEEAAEIKRWLRREKISEAIWCAISVILIPILLWLFLAVTEPGQTWEIPVQPTEALR